MAPSYMKSNKKTFHWKVFFHWDSFHARLNSHYKPWSFKIKKYKKIKAYGESLYKEPRVNRCLLILNLSHLDYRSKESFRQRIPESSCARKETVDIEILVTSRNGDKKNMQYIRILSRPLSRKRKWN